MLQKSNSQILVNNACYNCTSERRPRKVQELLVLSARGVTVEVASRAVIEKDSVVPASRLCELGCLPALMKLS